MKTKWLFYLIAFIMILALVVGCEREIVSDDDDGESTGLASYVGSDACQTCHEDIYTTFMNTGHPYKLNAAADVQAGDHYPYTANFPDPPTGYGWDDISYVIGGFWWKARFVDNDGYIITGDAVQWNFETEEYVGYHSSEAPGTKPYDCGVCHTTGYSPDGHQDGLEGMTGTWAAPGVHCEECHGPGSNHRDDPENVNMIVDRSAESCGECHIRGAANAIPASGGFIRHHEQWNEMATTMHRVLDCTDCHDPHLGLHELNPDKANAIITQCEDCHLNETASFMNSSLPHHENELECESCHMPLAAKSAVGDTLIHQGDIQSHLWRINTDPTATLTDGGSLANGYLTLDFTCLTTGCHVSETKAWAADYADQVHTGDITTIDDCFTCHGDDNLMLVQAHGQWERSQHASGENLDRNRNSNSYYQSCERCHTSEGFIAEVTGVDYEGDHFSAIGCFTCHAPHSNGNLSLRVENAVTLEDGSTFDRGHANLCASCHQSRRDVNTYVSDDVTLSEHWGPHHSNQGDMLVGTNAYEYDAYTYSNSAHTNVATDGCIDCHMTGSIGYYVGGHTMTMHDEESEYENLAGCNAVACHNGDMDSLNVVAASDFDNDGSVEGIGDEIQGLLDSLSILLVDAGFYDDVNGHPIEDVEITDSDSSGALYNFEFVAEDRSNGVHNTDYTVGLLQSSIGYLAVGDPNGFGTLTTAAVNRKFISAH
ncbi:MAG: hypothetical protein GY839_12710 [candidate division Zixibacteria bacterium]|nr:hypothetical protein [candidate division Zixibacteria bacterium]